MIEKKIKTEALTTKKYGKRGFMRQTATIKVFGWKRDSFTWDIRHCRQQTRLQSTSIITNTHTHTQRRGESELMNNSLQAIDLGSPLVPTAQSSDPFF